MICFNIQNIGKINKLFGPTEGDNVVIYAAHTLRDIGQRERYIFAHIYSNLLGLIVKNRSEEYIQEQIAELTKLIEGYSDSFKILTSFGVYHISDKKQPITQMINACMLAQRFVKDPEKCNYVFYTEELESDLNQNKKIIVNNSVSVALKIAVTAICLVNFNVYGAGYGMIAFSAVGVILNARDFYILSGKNLKLVKNVSTIAAINVIMFLLAWAFDIYIKNPILSLATGFVVASFAYVVAAAFSGVFDGDELRVE